MIRAYLVLQILVVIAEVCYPPPAFVIVLTALVIGIYGTLAAHEYLHRGDPLATIAFGAVSYSHFKISHIQGHHARVGFYDDWSTARRGESVYAFVVRAIAMGWVGAWRIESRRLRRRGERVLSLHHFMIRWMIFEVAVLVLCPHPGVFVALSLGAAICTELINYLGHYGLTRAVGEPISALHSWESEDGFILNAGRHCDHHSHPTRHYDRLTLTVAERRVPFRVPTLLMLALAPPIFFRVMHRYLPVPRVAAHRTSDPTRIPSAEFSRSL